MFANGIDADANSVFIFPAINLNEEGLYIIKFYVLLNCDDNSDCTKYDDFININLIYGTNEDQEINLKYDFKNIDAIRRWTQKSFNFISRQTNLKVITFKYILYKHIKHIN